jgi:DNA-binding response OmpR family regulator
MSHYLERNIEHEIAEINLNILIVDDEEWITDILQQFTSKLGYQADISMTGGDALEQIQNNCYDLVLLDVNLPDIEGIELISQIQQIHPGIMIVIMTGENNRERELQARQYNIVYYLLKPFTFDEICEIFSHVTQKSQQSIPIPPPCLETY